MSEYMCVHLCVLVCYRWYPIVCDLERTYVPTYVPTYQPTNLGGGGKKEAGGFKGVSR